MTYPAATPRIVEIKSRYRAETGHKMIAGEVQHVADEMLAVMSTLSEDEARRMLDLIRELLDVVEENMQQGKDAAP